MEIHLGGGARDKAILIERHLNLVLEPNIQDVNVRNLISIPHDWDQARKVSEN